MPAVSFGGLSIKMVKALLSSHGCLTTGNKDELVQRLDAKVAEIAHNARETELRGDKADSVSVSSTTALVDSVSAVVAWRDQLPAIIQRVESAIDGAKELLEGGSAAQAQAHSNGQLVKEAAGALAEIRQVQGRRAASEPVARLDQVCGQLSARAEQAALSVRGSLNDTCSVCVLLQRNDVRSLIFTPARLGGLCGLWRLRRVCKFWRVWLMEVLQQLPRVTLCGGRQEERYWGNQSRAVQQLDLSSLVVTLLEPMPESRTRAVSCALPDGRSAIMGGRACDRNGREVRIRGTGENVDSEELLLQAQDGTWNSRAMGLAPASHSRREEDSDSDDEADESDDDDDDDEDDGEDDGDDDAGDSDSAEVSDSDDSDGSDDSDDFGAPLRKPFFTDLKGARAVALSNNRIFAAGGYRGNSWEDTFDFRKSVAVLDIRKNTWTALPDMKRARYEFAMGALQDGRVIVAGGSVLRDDTSMYNRFEKTRTAEIYSPVTKEWTSLPDLNHMGGPYSSSAEYAVTLGTVTSDNRFFVRGMNPRVGTQIFDPEADTWSSVGDHGSNDVQGFPSVSDTQMFAVGVDVFVVGENRNSNYMRLLVLDGKTWRQLPATFHTYGAPTTAWSSTSTAYTTGPSSSSETRGASSMQMPMLADGSGTTECGTCTALH